ncbi:MAG: class I SAM-dependent RNA methyltransferase [Oscillochloridaceae bacterium umkhey_bin13]
MRSKEFRGLVANLVRQGAEAEPRCPHANECGGCAFQDRAYADQVAAKATALGQLYHGAGLINDVSGFEVVASPDPFQYRTRMDYVATKGRFGLRARGKFNYIIELTTCHLIPPAAFAAAHAVWTRAMELGLPDYNIRSHVGFLRYVVVRRSPTDVLLLAVVTAAGGDDATMAELADHALAQPGVVGFHWLRNATLTDLSFGEPVRHWGAEWLPMGTPEQPLALGPNTFFQNNIHLMGQLLDAVLVATQEVAGNAPVADLYGGIGMIGLHLAPHVAAVVSVEEVAESATLARENAAAAKHNHFTGVQQAVLPFLREQPVGAFGVVVADPPRTGLGPDVCTELRRIAPRRIVYVSCNPLTQVEDLQALRDDYRLVSLKGYDMFPHTPHVETLAVLERRAHMG